MKLNWIYSTATAGCGVECRKSFSRNTECDGRNKIPPHSDIFHGIGLSRAFTITFSWKGKNVNDDVLNDDVEGSVYWANVWGKSPPEKRTKCQLETICKPLIMGWHKDCPQIFTYKMSNFLNGCQIVFAILL